MKTLVFNGSPRKNGDTVFLIDKLKECLEGEVIIISAYYDKINPCVDCRYCWEKEGCSINDGMQNIYKLLDETDNIVIASPLYFSQLTGAMLLLASRFQTFYAAKFFRKSKVNMKKKNGILILTGGGDGSPVPAQNTASTIFKLINADYTDTVMSLKTDCIPSKEDEAAIKKIEEIADRLNTAVIRS